MNNEVHPACEGNAALNSHRKRRREATDKEWQKDSREKIRGMKRREKRSRRTTFEKSRTKQRSRIIVFDGVPPKPTKEELSFNENRH